MALSTVSSLSESFASGAPEESSNGHIHKPKGGVSPSDDTDECAEKAGSDVRGPSDDAGQGVVANHREVTDTQQSQLT